jgi:hypothetical protein
LLPLLDVLVELVFEPSEGVAHLDESAVSEVARGMDHNFVFARCPLRPEVSEIAAGTPARPIETATHVS